MPLGELAAGFIEVLFRFLGYFFLEVFLEIIVKGPGYIIAAHVFRIKHARENIDSLTVLLCGILFWLVLAGLAFLVYHFIYQVPGQ